MRPPASRVLTLAAVWLQVWCMAAVIGLCLLRGVEVHGLTELGCECKSKCAVSWSSRRPWCYTYEPCGKPPELLAPKGRWDFCSEVLVVRSFSCEVTSQLCRDASAARQAALPTPRVPTPASSTETNTKSAWAASVTGKSAVALR